MRHLGIDYGTKRIGVAVSDDTGSLAFPLGVVAAGQGALAEVLELARENGALTVVVGESRNFSGEKNPVMRKIEAFVAALRAAGKVVVLEPEFMTSAGAMHQFGHGHDANTGRASRKDAVSQEMLDASAAALILQSFLDKLRQGDTFQN